MSDIDLPITEFTPGNEVARSQLDAEIERLRAENAELRGAVSGAKSLLSQIEAGTTHAEGCREWGYKHYACALNENHRLHGENERLRKLYFLAAHDVIFFGTYDSKTDTWPDCGQFYTPVVNLNDTFAYACADAEELKDDQIDSLIRMYKEYDYPGIIAWAASIRGSEPIEPLRDEKYRIARAALSAGSN